MRQLMLIFLGSLMLAGCQTAVPVPPLSPEAQRVTDAMKAWPEVPTGAEAIKRPFFATIHILGKRVTASGILEYHSPRDFRITAVTEMGVILFDVRVNWAGVTALRQMPGLDKTSVENLVRDLSVAFQLPANLDGLAHRGENLVLKRTEADGNRYTWLFDPTSGRLKETDVGNLDVLQIQYQGYTAQGWPEELTVTRRARLYTISLTFSEGSIARRRETRVTETELQKTVLFWEVQRWRALQAELLEKHVKWCAERSGLYRGKGIVLEGGLRDLPLTTKNDVAAAGSAAFAISPEDVREWVCTSGTAGRALDVPLSAGDLQRLANNEAAALSLAGVGEGDLLLLGVGMDRMFVAGLAYWLGGQKLGASCVRIGPNMGMVEGIGARLGKGRNVFLVAVPSFLIGAKAQGLQSLGLGAEGKLAGIIAIGEPVRNADLSHNILGQKLAEQFGCPIMSTYASTETCTTFAEGPACLGGHLNPALGIVELLDDTGAAVADGEVGELVVTPLGVEGLPLLRFRTGDMTAIFSAKCPCGRTTPRIGPIIGRRQQLLKLRGTSVYPNAILEVLRGLDEVADCVIVAERDELGGDQAIVYAVARGEGAAIEAKLQAGLRVRVDVRLASETQLAELRGSAAGRKMRRFLDRRTN